MSRCMVLALLAVGACERDTEVVPPSLLLEETSLVGIEVVPSIGNAPHAVVVRAVNAYGASIPSTPQTLMVDGVEELVNFDGTGYGTLSLAEAGSYTVTGGGVQETTVHAVETDWGGVAMMPAELPPIGITEVRPATNGALAVSNESLWFISSGEVPTHRVLALPNAVPIEGMETVNLDLDGVLDAIVWGGSEVILLKGRPTGGFAWIGGYRGTGLAVGGAGAEDLDGDGDQDLAISWIDATGADRLQILHGDGVWGFEDVTVMSIQGVPIGGLAVGDNAGSGRIQTTVLLDTGRWQRFSITAAGSYVATGPNIATTFGVGSKVRSGRDANGDGADELYIMAPRQEGLEREIWIWDLFGASVQYRLLSPIGAEVALADSNGDGLEDVWWLPEDQELSVLAWAGTEYQSRRVAGLRSHGPIAVTEIDGDGEADLFVGGESLWTWQLGVQDEDQWWRPVEPGAERWEASLLGPIAELERVAGAGLVGFQGEAGANYLALWQANGGAPEFLGRVLLGDSDAEGVDLAVCDGMAWALTETTLFAVDVSSDIPTIVASRETSGTRVDCGDAPSDAKGALLEDDAVVLLGPDLSELGTESASAAVDVAIARASGEPSVATCAEADCRVLRWEWGAEGEQALVEASGDTLTLTLDDGTVVETAGGGELSSGDVDGDGNADLLAHRDGVITVWRSTGAGIGPARTWHTTRSLTGPVVTGDGDGDGWPDLWVERSGGDLFQSVAPGVVPSSEE